MYIDIYMCISLLKEYGQDRRPLYPWAAHRGQSPEARAGKPLRAAADAAEDVEPSGVGGVDSTSTRVNIECKR